MEFNAKKKGHVLEMAKSEMRPAWTCKLVKRYYIDTKRRERFWSSNNVCMCVLT